MQKDQTPAPARGATHKRTVIVLDADLNPIAVADVAALLPAGATFNEASDTIGQLIADGWAATHPEWAGVVAVYEEAEGAN